MRDWISDWRAPESLLRSPDPSPDQVAQARELLEVVRAALELLPETQRQAVLLYYLQGLSSQEIAALLGISTGAVRVRLHRARAELREQLSELAPHVTWPTEARKETLLMIEVAIEDVVVRITKPTEESPAPQHAGRPLRIVLLREKAGTRRLAIWIGQAEGDALAMQLAGAQPPRPMSADLTARLLGLAGARVERVTVDRLEENTFYATVKLAVDGSSHDVDARPSDALNLALRLSAPILVADELLAGAGAPDEPSIAFLEQETAKAMGNTGEEPPAGEWRSLTPELVTSLEAAPTRTLSPATRRD